MRAQDVLFHDQEVINKHDKQCIQNQTLPKVTYAEVKLLSHLKKVSKEKSKFLKYSIDLPWKGEGMRLLL